nr:hypothetical protein [Candidatus Sigynarchaeota archaeon]
MNEQQLIALVSELKPSCTAEELTTVENITISLINHLRASPGKTNPIHGIGKRELATFLEYMVNFWFEKRRSSKDILSANKVQFNQFYQAKETLFELLELGVWDSKYLPKTHYEAVLDRFRPDRRELLGVIAFKYLFEIKKRSLQEFIDFWNSIYFLMVPNRCIIFSRLELVEGEDPEQTHDRGEEKESEPKKNDESGKKEG